MSLRDRMIGVIYRAATGSRKVRNILTPAGVTFFFCLVLSFVLISLRVDRSLGLPPLLPPVPGLLLSIPVLAAGLIMMFWSILNFLKVRGTPVPFNPPPVVVKTGPYSCVRNPMLTGVFLLMFGIGLLLRSVSLVLIFTPLFILLNILELKKIEEPELEKRLGQEYSEYKKRVPMFIPRFRRNRDV